MRQCTHYKKRAGIVSNQKYEEYDRSLPHAARTVCDRPECIAAAIKWVAGETNMTATYYPDQH